MYNLTSLNSASLDTFNSFSRIAVQQFQQNPWTGVVAIGVIVLGIALSLARGNSDLKTTRKIAREICELKPTIGDADAYDFAASKDKYINDLNTKKGSLAMMAAGLKARVNGTRYGENGADVLRLGQDLLKSKSGQCDHMAAAVIAKIVEHIRKGGSWNTKVELVGNGGHAYVILNRTGELNDPSSWGKKTVIVDTWLGVLGINPSYSDQATAGDHGVISKPEEVLMNATGFKPDQLKLTRTFSAKELHQLASEYIDKV